MNDWNFTTQILKPPNMGKTKTPIMLARQTLMQEIERLTAHRDKYSQEGQQYWMDDAQIKATEGIVLHLNSLLPLERQAIVEAFDAGAVKSSFGGFLTPDGKSFYTTKYQSE